MDEAAHENDLNIFGIGSKNRQRFVTYDLQVHKNASQNDLLLFDIWLQEMDDKLKRHCLTEAMIKNGTLEVKRRSSNEGNHLTAVVDGTKQQVDSRIQELEHDLQECEAKLNEALRKNVVVNSGALAERDMKAVRLVAVERQLLQMTEERKKARQQLVELDARFIEKDQLYKMAKAQHVDCSSDFTRLQNELNKAKEMIDRNSNTILAQRDELRRLNAKPSAADLESLRVDLVKQRDRYETVRQERDKLRGDLVGFTAQRESAGNFPIREAAARLKPEGSEEVDKSQAWTRHAFGRLDFMTWYDSLVVEERRRVADALALLTRVEELEGSRPSIDEFIHRYIGWCSANSDATFEEMRGYDSISEIQMFLVLTHMEEKILLIYPLPPLYIFGQKTFFGVVDWEILRDLGVLDRDINLKSDLCRLNYTFFSQDNKRLQGYLKSLTWVSADHFRITQLRCPCKLNITCEVLAAPGGNLKDALFHFANKKHQTHHRRWVKKGNCPMLDTICIESDLDAQPKGHSKHINLAGDKRTDILAPWRNLHPQFLLLAADIGRDLPIRLERHS